MKNLYCLSLSLLILLSFPLKAFDIGIDISGEAEPFNPTTSVEVPLPPNGILKYTEVNIPQDVTVTFTKNAANTPVTLLVSGDVIVNGTISVDGGNGGGTGDGNPGRGGPGGFDGGYGAFPDASNINNRGGDGQGPGYGGRGGNGGGGGFGSNGSSHYGAAGGKSYGDESLIPLIGGSGGGGGGVSFNYTIIGPGGGGGGGAILIAASGEVTINGIIRASGGGPGDHIPGQTGFAGYGSGGAIRIVATSLKGTGHITAISDNGSNGVGGGVGRIRLEFEDNEMNFSNVNPRPSVSDPKPIFINDMPTLRISSVGGFNAPANPTGHKDIVLPGITSNPVMVEVETFNVPVDTQLILRATPERGGQAAVVQNDPSFVVEGSFSAGSATTSIALPNGNSVLSLQATFTVTSSTAAVPGMDFSKYAQGAPVKQVKVAFNPDGQSVTTFITEIGQRHHWTGGRQLLIH